MRFILFYCMCVCVFLHFCVVRLTILNDIYYLFMLYYMFVYGVMAYVFMCCSYSHMFYVLFCIFDFSSVIAMVYMWCFIYIYIYIVVCVHICIHTCIYTHISAYIYIYIYKCIYIYIYTNAYMYVYLCIYICEKT